MKKIPYDILVAVIIVAPIAIIKIVYDLCGLSTSKPGITGEEIISLMVGLITYYGTAILSLVTVKQNELLNSIELEQNKNAMMRLKIENNPEVMISYVLLDGEDRLEQRDIPKFDKNGFDYCFQEKIPLSEEHITVLLINRGNAPAKKIYGIDLRPEEKQKGYSVKAALLSDRLNPNGSEASIRVRAPDKVNSEITYSFNLVYQNLYDQYFYNEMFICISNDGEYVTYQVAINTQKDGKVGVDLKTNKV